MESARQAVNTTPQDDEKGLVRGVFLGADDGIRTRDPHLGNFEANVSCVAVNLTSAPELRVLVSPVSSVSRDRWSRRDFVGDSLVVDRLYEGWRPFLGVNRSRA